jgi:hypothetical protein
MAADTAPDWALFPWDDLARDCRADHRIRFYVDNEYAHAENARQLVDWQTVLSKSNRDRAFTDATSLESYAKFAARANLSAQSAARITDLTASLRWVVLRRILLARVTIVLVLLLLLLAFAQRQYLVFAGQVAAIVIAPAAGLIFRGAQENRSYRGFALGGLLAAAGLAVLVAPLVRGMRFPYPSWILALVFIGVTAGLALNYARWPALRELKTTLLLPGYFGLVKRAEEARQAWLRDAVEEAVIPELIHTINRLLAPDQERLLFVPDTLGLRARYQAGSQVPTRAKNRAMDALRRSDGASIAVSGPRGCGKTTMLNQLCKTDSRFSVVVSAPTRYAPKEFLIELFQRLCTKYITECGFVVERERARNAGRRLLDFSSSGRGSIVRLALAAISLVLLICDLFVWTAFNRLDRLGGLPLSLWSDKRVFIAVVLSLLVIVMIPSPAWRKLRQREPELVAQARRHLAQLQAEQTATIQVGGALPVMQAAFSRSVALKTLPWSMPELVGHLCQFIEAVTVAERARDRTVLICIDEIDRIGSAKEATQFLSEIKAIFGAAQCYFIVAIAEEFGTAFSRRAIVGRSVADNAFDEIISLEPMSFDMSRQLLQRRVPGFTDSFVWLALVLSGGMPRELIRVARRLVEITMEFEYKLLLPEFVERLVREEVYEAIVSTRSQIAQLPPGRDRGLVLDRLRQLALDFEPNDKPGGFPAALARVADLQSALQDTPAADEAPLRDAVTRLAAFIQLDITTYDAFHEHYSEPAAVYLPLAVARRELGVSAESCQAAVERIRCSLGLGHAARQA